MQKRTIVALPGDGIGKVVLEETIRVLDRAGFRALGDPYLEAGIRHVSMEMRLDADDT